jgi:hypothetical protein
MSQQEKNRRYLLELASAMFLYFVALFGALRIGGRLPHGEFRLAVLLSPVLPLGLAAWAIIRHVRRTDEFVRQTTLENIAVAAGVTALVTFTYGFLETAGYPRISMFFVWPLMGLTWLIAGTFRELCHR